MEEVESVDKREEHADMLKHNNTITKDMNVVLFVLLVALFVFRSVGAGQADPKLVFRKAPDGGFTFDTGIIKGTLGQKGRSVGIRSCTHVPTGARLDGSMGILSYYRIFTTDKRYGHAAWEWPSKAERADDGSVIVIWPAAAEHPFELHARYRLTEPAVIDVETSVVAKKELPCFEVFLASYFNAKLPASAVFVKEHPEGGGTPGFLPAKKGAGIWQMYPRTPAAVSVIQDGRWKKEPHPVDWAIRPIFSVPFGMRYGGTDSPAVLLMAPYHDCFALSTPYEGEGHFSLYLSLFGGTIKAGEKRSVGSRLVVCPTPPGGEKALEYYRAYMMSIQKK